jgi:hypothetical protein
MLRPPSRSTKPAPRTASISKIDRFKGELSRQPCQRNVDEDTAISS